MAEAFSWGQLNSRNISLEIVHRFPGKRKGKNPTFISHLALICTMSTGKPSDISQMGNEVVSGHQPMSDFQSHFAPCTSSVATTFPASWIIPCAAEVWHQVDRQLPRSSHCAAKGHQCKVTLSTGEDSRSKGSPIGEYPHAKVFLHQKRPSSFRTTRIRRGF